MPSDEGTQQGEQNQETPQEGEEKKTTVSLSMEEYEALKVRAATGDEAAKLQERWDHTQRMLQDGHAPEEVEKSMRFLLAEAGYPANVIDAYMAAQNEPPAPPAPEEGEGDDDVEEVNEDISALHAQVEAVTERQKAQRVKELGQLLSSQVDAAMQSREIGGLLDSVTRGAQNEKAEELKGKARGTLRKLVERETREILSRRRSQTGGWDDNWIQEAALAAAKIVADEQRTVIPDPSLVGRAPETDAVAERLRREKPVARPSYKPGMTADDASVKVREFAVDSLLRASTEQGAESKV